ncbi:MAG: hypothetical protein QW472_01565 [Candidatus Aenigmatarchaeota archaeon]
MRRKNCSGISLEFVKKAGIALFISDRLFNDTKKQKKKVCPKRWVHAWLSKEEYDKLLKAIELSPFSNFTMFLRAVVDSLVESLRNLEKNLIPQAAENLRKNHLEEVFLLKRPVPFRKRLLQEEKDFEPYRQIRIPLDYDDYLLLKKYFSPTGVFLKGYVMQATDLILNSCNA